MGVQVWRVPVPVPFVWPVCLARELISQLTRKPNVLSLQKYAELRAPGWVCQPTSSDAGFSAICPTGLEEGVKRTLTWYRQQGWL